MKGNRRLGINLGRQFFFTFIGNHKSPHGETIHIHELPLGHAGSLTGAPMDTLRTRTGCQTAYSGGSPHTDIEGLGMASEYLIKCFPLRRRSTWI
jgi:hypothetical protein